VIIGIDVGGTKTHVVADEGGTIVFDRVLPSSQWRLGDDLSEPGNVARLLDVVSAVPESATAALVIGAHGLDSDAQTAAFNRELAQLHSGPVLAVNDVELVGPAAGFDDAIALIVGTGSKVVAPTATGYVSAGGYGHVLSDAGSAPGLVRDSVKALLDAWDAGSRGDQLSDALMDWYGVGDVVALSYALSGNTSLSYWSEAAPLVFAAADSGSAIALGVIDAAAAVLASDIALVVQRGAIGTDVVCAGGVVTNQPLMFDALVRHITALGRGLAVHLLPTAPVHGALALGRRGRHPQHPINGSDPRRTR